MLWINCTTNPKVVSPLAIAARIRKRLAHHTGNPKSRTKTTPELARFLNTFYFIVGSPFLRAIKVTDDGIQFDEYKSSMRVVCAIIIQKGRFLLAKRPLSKNHGGKWEFPGGKIEKNEKDTQALSRELWEELQIKIHRESLEYLGHLVNEKITLHFYLYSRPAVLNPREHMALGWFQLKDIKKQDLCDLDRKACEKWGHQIFEHLGKSLNKT